MSKSNIERVIEEILSDEKKLIEFFSCENQDKLYKYCLSKNKRYAREEFDEFIEKTIEKAGKEVNQNSLSYGEARTSRRDFGEKVRRAFTKVLAAGLAVFSVVPMMRDLMPSVVQAIETVESVEKKADREKVLNKDLKNQKETKSLDSSKHNNEPNNGESELARKRRLKNKAKARKRALKKIMPRLLGTSAAGVTFYTAYHAVKYFLSNSRGNTDEEERKFIENLKTNTTELNQDSDSNIEKTNLNLNSRDVSADNSIKELAPDSKLENKPETTVENEELKQEEKKAELSQGDNSDSEEQQSIIKSVDNSTQEKTPESEPTNEPEPAILGSDIKTNQEEFDEDPDLLNFFEKVEAAEEEGENPNEKKNENSIILNTSSNLNSDIPANDISIKEQTQESEPTNDSKDKKENSNTKTSELRHEDNSNSEEQQPIIKSVDNSIQEQTQESEPAKKPETKFQKEEINENSNISNPHGEPKKEEDGSKNLSTNEPKTQETISSNVIPNEIQTPKPNPVIEQKSADDIALEVIGKLNESAKEVSFGREYLENFLKLHLPDVSYNKSMVKDSSPSVTQTHVSVQEATDILEKAKEIFEKTPRVAKINGSVMVTSDFHGSSGEARDSILKWLNELDRQEKIHYLSLGDYQDRSNWGMETFLALVILKCTYPDKVTLLMGNHDSSEGKHGTILRYALAITRSNHKTAEALENRLINTKFVEIFWDIVERLPLIAEVTVGDKKILCNHATVPHDGYSKKEYLKFNKIGFKIPKFNYDNPCYNKLTDIFYNDYGKNDGQNLERTMYVGLESYEKVMKNAKFDYAISGHEHTNISPITSKKYPLFKVCSQSFPVDEKAKNFNPAQMLIVREDESYVYFIRREYNQPNHSWLKEVSREKFKKNVPFSFYRSFKSLFNRNGNQQAKPESKTVFLGSSRSGKTDLINCIIGNDQEIPKCIFDITGQKIYKNSILNYVRSVKDADVFIFTISLEESEFQNQIAEISNFLKIFKDNVPKAQGIIVMTKADLVNPNGLTAEDAKLQVESKIRSFENGVLEYRITLFDKPVSAKNGNNIEDLKEFIDKNSRNSVKA